MNIIDFIKQIGIPEFKSVIGKWGSKIMFLVGILLISLIAMGVAEGSLNYLKEKMNDPFMQFVDVDHTLEPVDGYKEFNLKVAKDYLKVDSNGVKDVFETYAKFERFVNINNKDFEKTKEGFILDEQNEFYKSLIDKESGQLITKNKFHDNQWGIIITKRFMDQLGIDKETPYINIRKGNYDFPIPICGVVKKLRNKKDFIMTKKLYSLLYGNSHLIPLLKSDSSQGVCKWFIPNIMTLPDDLKDLGVVISDIYVEQSLPHVKGIMVETENFKIDSADSVKVNNTYKAYRVYDYNVRGDLEIKDKVTPDTYTLLFKHPDFVLPFDSWIEKKYGIDLEESRMEAKKNFSFFEKLSKLLSIALIAFSIISIIFFIINLLLSHINKNKRNLGTLKAFGLPNKHIIILYSTITLLLVTISYVSAYVLSDLLGQVVLDSYIAFKNISSENYLKNVEFDNRNFIITFLQFVLLPTIIIIYILYKYLHKVTPGDLIYERK
jgi:ABC-type antimicrobial peptide transport system permease subunit